MRETPPSCESATQTVERKLRRGGIPRVMIGYATRIHRWRIESSIEAHRIESHRPNTDGGGAA